MFILLSLLSLTQLLAKDYEYVPFVREDVKWVCSYPTNYGQDEGFFTLELKGDTVIDGHVYKLMHKYAGENIDLSNDEIPICLREEDRVVYGIVPGGKTSSECPIGISYDTLMLEKIASGQEFVLYDFQDPVGFIEDFVKPGYMPHNVIPDMVTIAGKRARRFIFNHGGTDYCMIDGIGYDGIAQGTPLSVMSIPERIRLSRVEENGEIIYRSEHYCSDADEYLPITREGVKWVNQKVTVNGNDTTYSYYTYEFSGTNYRDYPVLYRYEGDELDESATQAAVFRSNYIINFYPYYVMEVSFLKEMIDQGRTMMSYANGYGDYYLYQFNQTESDICIQNPVNFHIYYQKGEWLTRENFIETEPLIIEGKSCSRYAYLDENGEPKAYLIEGIGFDSRDMGDLLTPFTLPPDPDADYQEWCGLSHVIKDGEIIYKGMCYDAERVQEAMAIGQPGDVNGDGIVNVTDVTLLIDMVINSSSQGSYILSGDMDHNGEVNVTDVVRLINLVIQE